MFPCNSGPCVPPRWSLVQHHTQEGGVRGDHSSRGPWLPVPVSPPLSSHPCVLVPVSPPLSSRSCVPTPGFPPLSSRPCMASRPVHLPNTGLEHLSNALLFLTRQRLSGQLIFSSVGIVSSPGSSFILSGLLLSSLYTNWVTGFKLVICGESRYGWYAQSIHPWLSLLGTPIA